MFSILTRALAKSDKKFEKTELLDTLSKVINKNIKYRENTAKRILKDIITLQPYQLEALLKFFEYNLLGSKDDVLTTIKNIINELFIRENFFQVIFRKNEYIYRDLFDQYSNPLLFSKGELEKICELPDGRCVRVLGKKKAIGDGNCGFRAILGEDYLTNNKNLLKRSAVIELLKDNIEDPIVNALVARDLEAKYQEYIAETVISNDMPEDVKKQFEGFKMNAERATTDPNLQEQIMKQVSSYCARKDVLKKYLEEYLIFDHHWPHIQGSLAAFGHLCGIKIHCIQNMSKDSTHPSSWLKYIDSGQPENAEYIEEVFIKLNKAGTHFDGVAVDLKGHVSLTNSNLERKNNPA